MRFRAGAPERVALIGARGMCQALARAAAVVFVACFLVAAAASDVVSQAQTRVLSRQEVADLLRRYVKDTLGAAGRVEIDIRRAPEKIVVSGRTGRIDISPVGSIRPGVVCSFRLRYPVSDGSLRTTIVAARVLLYDRVVVAARDLPPRTRIGPQDVRLEERSVGSIFGKPFRDTSEVIGKETRGTIRRGSVLTGSALETPSLVRRGEIVKVVAACNNVQVETTGRALESGGLGDQVLVRNPSSGRSVRGEVIGPGRVLVRP